MAAKRWIAVNRVKAPAAVVMNMFYTGLGIARSLGEQGIPVIGLSTRRGHYGNLTRYADVRLCPDSRNEPEALLSWMLRLGADLPCKGVLFPTRDDDVVFLDRFRTQLEPYFITTVPASPVVKACLNKWKTYQCALEAGVAAPKCWLIEREQDLLSALDEVTYPCVLKPVAAHHWRRGDNWQIVGGRKAFEVASREQLLTEYAEIARADQRILLQEMVPGPDDCLVVAACYMDRDSNCVAEFNSRKLLQIPEGFGTGCIVQTVSRPALVEPTIRLLSQMKFTGIAEVEYKWDTRTGEYLLIEVNPRAWDQHRLGNASGVDLIVAAYREHAGIPLPPAERREVSCKWISEDTFLTAVLRSLYRRDSRILTLFRLARGKRIYSIWSARDPLPFLVFFTSSLFPQLAAAGARWASAALKNAFSRKLMVEKKGLVQ